MSKSTDTNKFHRRTFLEKGTTAATSVALSCATVSMVSAGEKPPKKLRIGVIGTGRRSNTHLRQLLKHNDNVVVPAICDCKPAALASGVRAVQSFGGGTPETYGKDEYAYRDLLARDDIDGVIVATDCQWLGKISIDALKADKYVGSEVTGTHSLEECWELVKAKEKSKGRYMLLENASYGRETLIVLNMIRKGVFGNPCFGVGSYIHDCRFLAYEPDGQLTWRGRMVRDDYGCNYPSHAIGSPAKWLGINDGDRMVSLTAVMTEPQGLHDQAVKKFGPDSPQAKIKFKSGDITIVNIRTAKGKVLRIDCGLGCTRPYSRYYTLQGLTGCYDSRKGVYINNDAGKVDAVVWPHKLVKNYAAEFEHKLYREEAEQAKKAGGHGGLDYFVNRDFLQMIREDKDPWIDAYDAAAWTSIMHLSRHSIDKNSAPVDIPDFTGGRWKNPDWRKGRMA
ncbi:MAG: Gfo/Idh/MocA family oxidoreductase [Pirellulales bacterium]|nr:Gfo/Idh/MocA family oxidoreductase [Pirellulales bacterium]